MYARNPRTPPPPGRTPHTKRHRAPRWLPLILLVLAVSIPTMPPACGLHGGPAMAQGGAQDAVIGVTVLGIHNFDDPDPARAQYFSLLGNIAGIQQFYAEFYGGRMGLGYRYQHVGKSEKASVGGVPTRDSELAITAHLLTVQAQPWISDGGYARLVLAIGGGPSHYRIVDRLGADQTFATDGTAVFYGLHLDWGGEGFGARLGWSHLCTRYADMNFGATKVKADGSGGQTTLDLRWAF